MPHARTLAAIRRALLHWFDRHGRDLPWRDRQRSGYHILVSEAMLQQTQVATVIPYYQRFIDTWPNVQALAAADEQQVLRLWQGLGYYRRARHLHAAARRIEAEHGGMVPDEVAHLLALPGVGRYTAGAIASIAYNRRAPILDGNVARVLARWFAIDQSIDGTTVKARLWSLAEAVLPRDRPGDFNEAMMDLGATICTPRNPSCATCPVSASCRARAQRRVDDLPVRAARRKAAAVTHHIVGVERRGRWLFVQRPAVGLWSNMWQMPTWEADTRQSAEAVATWLHKQTALQAVIEPCHTFGHQTTHRAITFVLWRVRKVAGRLKSGVGVWRALDDLDDLPMANPQRRAVRTFTDMAAA